MSNAEWAVTIYNDGDIAVQYIGRSAAIERVMGFSRLHKTEGLVSREKFLADLPANQGFLYEARHDLPSWIQIQDDIAKAIGSCTKSN